MFSKTEKFNKEDNQMKVRLDVNLKTANGSIIAAGTIFSSPIPEFVMKRLARRQATIVQADVVEPAQPKKPVKEVPNKLEEKLEEVVPENLEEKSEEVVPENLEEKPASEVPEELEQKPIIKTKKKSLTKKKIK